MNIRNEDVKGLIMEVPEGHRHLRTTLLLEDGTELTFQEATVANLVRAYVTVKTHPATKRVRFTGKVLEERKAGYAQWQLIEDEDI
jgi:hypothetical protein